MKKLSLLLSLILTTSILFGQDMLLKKQTTLLGGDGGPEEYSYYKYDESWSLDSVIKVNETGDTLSLHLYTHGSIVKDWQPDLSKYYSYQNDSILVYYESTAIPHYLAGIYFLNEKYETVLLKSYNSDGTLHANITFTWQEGNCMASNYNTGEYESMTYDDEILNPSANANKYFKRTFFSSKNILTHGEFVEQTMDLSVLTTKNNYPTEIIFSNNGGPYVTILYEYYDFTSIENLEIKERFHVIGIEYYNLLGQQIEKPTKGFYLECKITDKGVISKKFLIL